MIDLIDKKLKQDANDYLAKIGLANRPVNTIIDLKTENPNPVDIWQTAHEDYEKELNQRFKVTARLEEIKKTNPSPFDIFDLLNATEQKAFEWYHSEAEQYINDEINHALRAERYDKAVFNLPDL